MTPKPDDLEPHLRYKITARGALVMPELHTNAHGALHLSESTSSGSDAFVWLRASAASSLDHPHTDRHEVVLHVTLNDIEALMEQCRFLLDHHHNVAKRKTISLHDGKQLRKCCVPECFRQTTQLSGYCCYRCQVTYDGHLDMTHDHTKTCEERLAARGEWKVR